MKINGEAPGVMAEDAKRLGALLVHNSADYVFDGRKDAPNPLSVYGRTKLAGQEAIRASSARHLFLHTSWVYGMRGRNSLLNILRLVHEREELLIVADQFGAPTWRRMIAKVTAAILARIAGGRTAPESFDTCHLTAASASCWHEFAPAICEFAGKREAFMLGRVEPIAIAGYPIPTVRPGNWRMCLDNIERAFGLDLPSWEHCLQPCREQ
jgi:dTDP-4-dehydrorhamnose reductase